MVPARHSIQRTYPTRTLFGIPVAAVTMSTALDIVHEAIVDRAALQIGVVNAAKIVNMGRDTQLRDSVLSSTVVFADGMSIVWASWLLGRHVPERIAGIDLMNGILTRGNEHGYRVFCLGATQDVLDRVVRTIGTEYPRVNVVGSRDGYFDAAEESDVAGQIARSRADVLFVAMTSPKKERFLARWSGTMAVPVCHGVGGSFDVLAGKVKRAPDAWQRFGLEWLYRVKEEPSRLWRRYLVTNVLFSSLLAKELLGSRRTQPAAAAGKADLPSGTT